MLFPLFLFAHESLASLSFSRQGSKQCQWWRMVCIYLKTIEKAEKTGRIYFEKHVMNDQTLALAYAIFSRCMHFSLISLFSGGISLAAGLFFMFQSLSTCVYFEKFAFTLKSNPLYSDCRYPIISISGISSSISSFEGSSGLKAQAVPAAELRFHES